MKTTEDKEATVNLPRSLTAENGAKGLLIGEFFESIEIPCPECAENEEVSEDCDCCNGYGSVTQKVPVSWDTIKDIYKKIVENMAVKP